VCGLAAELRAGGLMAAALAFGLGAIGTVALLAIIARCAHRNPVAREPIIANAYNCDGAAKL
jgi:hypothetical protein